MAWRKMGLIFDLQHYHIPWLKSHAMLPTPLLLDDRIRVYYTGRDQNGQSRISYVDLERSNPSVVMYVHELPLLELGKIGTFDDSGTLGVCAVKQGNDVYLYYNGYNRRVTVPWSNAVGLAISKDGGQTFRKAFEGPILDRTAREPYFAITPCILKTSDRWHMWYTSGTGWITVRGTPEPLYVIKYSHSGDGIIWKRENITCIQPLSPEEANARAAVVYDGGIYKMWFTYRGSQNFRDGSDSYRIGYATSADAVHWARRDGDAGISYSDDGWDSRMQTYPSVVDVNGKRYLFYNGNGFGQAGFGCAKWEE
jgi:hypothetical protein